MSSRLEQGNHSPRSSNAKRGWTSSSVEERSESIYLDDDDDDEERVLQQHNSNNNNTLSSRFSSSSSNDRDALRERYHRRSFSQESKTVDSVRRLLYATLFLTAGVISYLVYYFVDQSEQDAFESQFQEHATQVLQSFAMSLDLTLGAMDTLALAIASYARATNQPWPYVTIPDFSARAEKTRALTNAVYLNLYMNVNASQRLMWENYSSLAGPEWVQDALEFQERQDLFQDKLVEDLEIEGYDDVVFWNVIHDYGEWDKPEEEWGTVGLTPREYPQDYLPMWQTSPLLPGDPPYNWDLLSIPVLEDWVTIFDNHKAVFTETYLIAYPNETEALAENEAEADFLSSYVLTDEDPNAPIVDIYYPIIADMADYVRLPFTNGTYDPDEHHLGALLSASIYWRDWIKGILPEGENGIIVTWKSPCAPSFTYQINGPMVEFLGAGELHESQFGDMLVSASLQELNRYTFRNQLYTGIPLDSNLKCPFTLNLYPSTFMEDKYRTNKPAVFCGLTVTMFVLGGICLFVYNHLVEKRKAQLVKTAQDTDAIVSNMLPSEIRDRLYQNAENRHREHDDGDDDDDDMDTLNGMFFGGGPIAELYPSATVIFIDITGFAAWSSTREPSQIFELLETIYGRWDKLASRRGVLKIETVGDCYVAVAGLPRPNNQHVTDICRFARDILQGWSVLTEKLEVTLGPDTTDLKVRIGIHSGQVTAGVLRGTMARYQLFGDTVNTCAGLQETADPGKVHVSTASAEMLQACGKAAWIKPRKEKVSVKGKGEMETYWLKVQGSRDKSTRSGTTVMVEPEMAAIAESVEDDVDLYEEGDDSASFSEVDLGIVTDPDAKRQRLVQWNAQVLGELLEEILAARDPNNMSSWSQIAAVERKIGGEMTVLEEFQEIIEMPVPNAESAGRRNMQRVRVDDDVRYQLNAYLTVVASMYRDNHFHNFEHATHVTASVRKMLTRIVNVDDGAYASHKIEDMVGHSYGIASDPLTQFTVVLSAVIHDCDHPGVPNTTLVAEKTTGAMAYKFKSVAEQNSVDICWELLMQPEYKKLRACIYQNESELFRFRQLLVNVVMATDIADRELGALRKARWAVAFSDDPVDSTPKIDMNRKATIVLEHLIQASDVCHTMQHWDIYRAWNEKFFFELYTTYQEGRAPSDPSVGWYKGEIGFFDFYVIPLAKKLFKCGVFGVSSHEYLKYAQENRDKWEREGEACVADYLAKYKESMEE